jgi:hypothetical protein
MGTMAATADTTVKTALTDKLATVTALMPFLELDVIKSAPTIDSVPTMGSGYCQTPKGQVHTWI